jgi:polyhydroxybutyrate depolymerase
MTSLRAIPALLVGLCVTAVGCFSTSEPVGENYLGALWFGDTLRTFVAYLPEAADTAEALPMLLLFHGGLGDADDARYGSGFDETAEEYGIVAVYPDGLDGWAEGYGCGAAEHAGVNDTGFVRLLIDKMVDGFPIDEDRVYVAGFSQGGLFVHFLACKMSDELAGVASVAGPITFGAAADCQMAPPLAVFTMQGTEDGAVPYDGAGGAPCGYLGAEATLDYWAAMNDCPGEVAVETEWPDLVEDGTRVYQHTYSQCSGGSEVMLLEVEGGYHNWHMSSDFNINDAIASFLLSHRRPTP